MEIFRSVTPLVEAISLDEAFLDVGGATRRLGRPAQIAELMRGRIADEQGITASVGVAPTKFVAKLASARCKPDGLLVVPADRVVEFLHPLPVGRPVGSRREDRGGADPARPAYRRRHRPHPARPPWSGRWVRRPASTSTPCPGAATNARWCRRSRTRASATRRRSAPTWTTRWSFTASCCGSPSAPPPGCAPVTTRAGRSRIKVRFADFSTITRSRTLREPTDIGREIYDTARQLFDGLGLERARIRLVGVRIEGLVAADSMPRQLAFGERESGWREADRAVDRAARRFGAGAVRPAVLVRSGPGRATGRRPPTRSRTGCPSRRRPAAPNRTPQLTSRVCRCQDPRKPRA